MMTVKGIERMEVKQQRSKARPEQLKGRKERFKQSVKSRKKRVVSPMRQASIRMSQEMSDAFNAYCKEQVESKRRVIAEMLAEFVANKDIPIVPYERARHTKTVVTSIPDELYVQLIEYRDSVSTIIRSMIAYRIGNV